MSDPDFGAMRHNNIDAWDCRMDFDFPHLNARQFAVHVWASLDGPTPLQRQVFRELKRRYKQLWPKIADGILRVHPSHTSAEALANAVGKYVSVHLGGFTEDGEFTEDAVELVYDLAGEPSRGYFVRLNEWNVREVVVAE